MTAKQCMDSGIRQQPASFWFVQVESGCFLVQQRTSQTGRQYLTDVLHDVWYTKSASTQIYPAPCDMSVERTMKMLAFGRKEPHLVGSMTTSVDTTVNWTVSGKTITFISDSGNLLPDSIDFS